MVIEDNKTIPIDFEDFCKIIKLTDFSDHYYAFRAVIGQYQVVHGITEPIRVLLAIDELLKSTIPAETLQKACRLMEKVDSVGVKSVNVISTTLDAEVILNEQTQSHRKVVMAPLPALHNLFELFPNDAERVLAFRLGGVISVTLNRMKR